jgi:uncharacterized membrane protein YbhN (UPF0104 family)
LKKKAIQALKFSAFLLLGLLLLYLAFRNTSIDDLRDGLKDANYNWLLLALPYQYWLSSAVQEDGFC